MVIEYKGLLLSTGPGGGSGIRFAVGGPLPLPDMPDGRIPEWIGAGCGYVTRAHKAAARDALLRQINESREDTER